VRLKSILQDITKTYIKSKNPYVPNILMAERETLKYRTHE
jgi:hypothetical protein